MNPYDLVIADLQQKRDELERVIAMLKVMRGDGGFISPEGFAGQFPPARPGDQPVRIEPVREFLGHDAASAGVSVGGGVLTAPLPTQRAPVTGKVTVAKP